MEISECLEFESSTFIEFRFHGLSIFIFFLRFENIVNIMKLESHEVTLSEHCTHLDVLVNQVPKGDSVTGICTL